MANKTNLSYWLDGLHPFPLHIVYVPNEKAWAHFQKKHIVGLDPVPYPDSSGCVYYFSREGHNSYITVTFDNERIKKKSYTQVAGLVAHECMHIWQHILEDIGEKDKPSSEIEAYFIQALTQGVLQCLKDEGYKWK